MTAAADTQQALKARIVAALVTNGWGTVFETWWRSYNRPGLALPQDLTDRSVGAYLDRIADDIAEALIHWEADCSEFGCHDEGTRPL